MLKKALASISLVSLCFMQWPRPTVYHLWVYSSIHSFVYSLEGSFLPYIIWTHLFYVCSRSAITYLSIKLLNCNVLYLPIRNSVEEHYFTPLQSISSVSWPFFKILLSQFSYPCIVMKTLLLLLCFHPQPLQLLTCMSFCRWLICLHVGDLFCVGDLSPCRWSILCQWSVSMSVIYFVSVICLHVGDLFCVSDLSPCRWSILCRWSVSMSVIYFVSVICLHVGDLFRVGDLSLSRWSVSVSVICLRVGDLSPCWSVSMLVIHLNVGDPSPCWWSVSVLVISTCWWSLRVGDLTPCWWSVSVLVIWLRVDDLSPWWWSVSVSVISMCWWSASALVIVICLRVGNLPPCY